MKKTLLICVMAACVAGCVEKRKDEYVMGYEFVPAPAYTYVNTGCSTCGQPVTTCNTCAQPIIQPVLQQQPKQVIVVQTPQPVVEQEIVYQPQPACGCKKCGCNKAAK